MEIHAWDSTSVLGVDAKLVDYYEIDSVWYWLAFNVSH